jgi:hypothetical protein
VTNGVLSAAATPFQLTQGGDAWDHQFLQGAIDLDGQLASFGNGLDAQLGSATGAAFFRAVVPVGTDVSYIVPFFPYPRSDVLIGWVISSDAAQAANVAVNPVFETIMQLWVNGESWGVIAMESHVSGDAIFAGLQDAINRLRISLQSPTPKLETVPAATTGPHPRVSPSPTAQRLPTVTPVTTPTPAPTGLGALLNPVTSLLGQILNLLLPAPAPAPAPTPTPTS